MDQYWTRPAQEQCARQQRAKSTVTRTKSQAPALQAPALQAPALQYRVVRASRALAYLAVRTLGNDSRRNPCQNTIPVCYDGACPGLLTAKPLRKTHKEPSLPGHDWLVIFFLPP